MLPYLLQEYGPLFYGRRGADVRNELLQRSEHTPLTGDLDDLRIGHRFPLLGYRHLAQGLAEAMCILEENHNSDTPLDLQLRQHHILQLAGPPGFGKSTAASAAMWVALHQLCASGDVPVTGPAARIWPNVCNRILRSVTPGRMLVFVLDFRPGEFICVFEQVVTELYAYAGHVPPSHTRKAHSTI